MKAIYLMFVAMLIFSAGCREEVIPPLNLAGNINDPVESLTNSSYSILLSGDDFTSNIFKSLPLNKNKANLYITVKEYNSGSVSVNISSNENRSVFTKNIAQNVDDYFKIEYQVPKYISLNFDKFSGKIKLEISLFE